jgi:hypothetical protein
MTPALASERVKVWQAIVAGDQRVSDARRIIEWAPDLVERGTVFPHSTAAATLKTMLDNEFTCANNGLQHPHSVAEWRLGLARAFKGSPATDRPFHIAPDDQHTVNGEGDEAGAKLLLRKFDTKTHLCRPSKRTLRG